MTCKQLKEILEYVPDNAEIFREDYDAKNGMRTEKTRYGHFEHIDVHYIVPDEFEWFDTPIPQEEITALLIG